MHSCATSKNVMWCHLIWPTLYINIPLISAPSGILYKRLRNTLTYLPGRWSLSGVDSSFRSRIILL